MLFSYHKYFILQEKWIIQTYIAKNVLFQRYQPLDIATPFSIIFIENWVWFKKRKYRLWIRLETATYLLCNPIFLFAVSPLSCLSNICSSCLFSFPNSNLNTPTDDTHHHQIYLHKVLLSFLFSKVNGSQLTTECH